MINDNPLIQSLKELCLFLDDAGMKYALVGGLAVGIWAAPRATVDIDFLISLRREDSGLLSQRLKDSNSFLFIHESPMTFKKISLLRATLKSNPDISVDFLFADDEFKQEVLKRSTAVPIHGFSVMIPTPEDLILLKLISSRPQDKLDAEKIREMQAGRLDMEYIRMWSRKLDVEFSS
jgi:predicted nucleotidyltransferase